MEISKIILDVLFSHCNCLHPYNTYSIALQGQKGGATQGPNRSKPTTGYQKHHST